MNVFPIPDYMIEPLEVQEGIYDSCYYTRFVDADLFTLHMDHDETIEIDPLEIEIDPLEIEIDPLKVVETQHHLLPLPLLTSIC